ncbi:Phosphopantetheine attachment site [Rhodococcoides kyotonense]|uniref:Phosphopantetheine attachment site n=1 Tax=Rhodococcoides kyotonense TaxID=398843 RepID=A0A239L3A6_9NOCA|nr:Phosphopantetheine attachment site [Rhodococcus kyotonensis]
MPSAMVIMDSFPLMSNGKLDRRSLPTPEFGAGEYRAPSNRSEALLAELFGEILGVDSVGVDDSFFDLGGNSLLATRLTTRSRSVLGMDLPVRAVFRFPTVAELAPRLTELSKHEHSDPFASIFVIIDGGDRGEHSSAPLWCITQALESAGGTAVSRRSCRICVYTGCRQVGWTGRRPSRHRSKRWLRTTSIGSSSFNRRESYSCSVAPWRMRWPSS